jgi:hypothetical protein
MNWKQLAALGALACTTLPAQAWDFREQDQPYTFAFLRIPIDGRSTREQLPVWGFAVRGKREYQVLRMDSESMTRFVELGFIESKFLIVGAVAAAGAVAVGASGSKSAASQQQQQQINQQAAQQQAAAPAGQPPRTPPSCPTPATNPCH